MNFMNGRGFPARGFPFTVTHFSAQKRVKVLSKVPVIVVRFNQNWDVLINFSKTYQYQMS